MRVARSLLVLSLGLLTAAGARADHFRTTRSELLAEIRPRLSVKLDHGFATMVIERTGHNGGVAADQGIWVLSLPRGGVAVGLRTLGTLRGEPHWWTGDLMDAEVAAAKYRMLTSMGGFTPKDPALLSWRSQGEVVLQAFPFPPREDKSVEATVMVPTEWRNGREVVDLQTGTPLLPVDLDIVAAREGERALVDGVPIEPGAHVSVDGKRSVELCLDRPVVAPLEVTLSSIELSPGRAAVRWQLRAPPHLAEKPADARIVIVLDASRSMRDKERDAAIAAARAYLSHVPDASVEIVTFHRHARALLGRFAPALEAARALSGVALSRENGSRLDRGLELADDLLSHEPDDRPRRVVLITDLLTSKSLTPESASAALTRSHALVHLGVIGASAPRLSRNDYSPWKSLTRPTGGLVWSAYADPDELADSEMRRVYEEWARPLSIDHLHVAAAGVDPSLISAPDRLAAGDSAEGALIATKATDELSADGELWATPLRVRGGTTLDETTRWSALVFGSNLLSDLKDPEMRKLAARGGAVSPVSSYLAIEPGTRPSIEGLEHGRLGGSHRSRAPQIRMGATSVSREQQEREHLERELGDAWRACGGERRVTISVETTRDEIVDVHVPATPTSLSRELACVEEATWGLVLPSFFVDSYSSWSISVGK